MVRHTLIATAIVIMLSASVPRSAAAPQGAVPETVMVTYHPKPGSEAALANAIARQWAVEIFTWRDGNIPDAPPAAIQKIWAEMNQLVESRGGEPGIHFTAVSVVAQ